MSSMRCWTSHPSALTRSLRCSCRLSRRWVEVGREGRARQQQCRQGAGVRRPARRAQYRSHPQSAFGIVTPAETGSTFLENALLKARHAAQLSGLAALADDSGIEVEALGGRPGVWSARYAGEHASDADNLNLLLQELSGVPEGQRRACYRCVLVFVRAAADPDPIVTVGVWAGRVLTAPRGAGALATTAVSTRRLRAFSGAAARGAEECRQSPPRRCARCWPRCRDARSPPLALYLHFPWCVRKCPYCDFNSYTLSGELPEADYLAALSRDMRAQATSPQVSGRSLSSIFMGAAPQPVFGRRDRARAGGGTRAVWFCAGHRDHLEANPGTIERGASLNMPPSASTGSRSRPKLRREAAAGAGPDPFVADTARLSRNCTPRSEQFQPGPDVRAAEQDVAGARFDLNRRWHCSLPTFPTITDHGAGTVFGPAPPLRARTASS